MDTGTPVQLPDNTIGSIVEIKDDWAVVAVSVEVLKYGNEGDRLIATIQSFDVPLSKLSAVTERNEHIRKDGTIFYTDQHGEVIA